MYNFSILIIADVYSADTKQRESNSEFKDMVSVQSFCNRQYRRLNFIVRCRIPNFRHHMATRCSLWHISMTPLRTNHVHLVPDSRL